MVDLWRDPAEYEWSERLTRINELMQSSPEDLGYRFGASVRVSDFEIDAMRVLAGAYEGHRWVRQEEVGQTLFRRPYDYEQDAYNNPYATLITLGGTKVRHEGMISRVLERRQGDEAEREKVKVLLTNGGYLACVRAVEVREAASGRRRFVRGLMSNGQSRRRA